MKRVMMLGLLGLLSAARAEFSLGDVPPDFTCTDWNGNSWSFYEQFEAGKVVLLNFGATWCGPCNAEMPELQANFFEHYDPAGFSIVHIDTDGITASALHNHWDNLGVTFPVLVGCDDLYADYGDNYIPYNCLLNSDGEVLYASSGYNPDALHSLIEANIHVDHPVLSMQTFTVSDDGNSDGRPDGGETVTLTPVLRVSNIGEATTGGSVTLSCGDPAVTIQQATVSFQACEPGSTVTGQSGFVITVAAGIQPHWATLNLAYQANYSGGVSQGQLQYEQRMGRPSLLVVDSDGASDNNETYLLDSLTVRGLGYDIWAGLDNPIASEEVQRYNQLIWLGGLNENDMTDDEETGLRAFVGNGGKLLLSSQFMSDNPERADFLAEVFGVTVADADGGNIFVVDCAAGDPWFGGSAFVVSGNQAADNNEEPDILTLSGSSTVFATWRQAGNQPAAVYTNGDTKAIFCGFPVEATRRHSSVAGSMHMGDFLNRVLAYFELESDLSEPTPVAARAFRILDAQPNPFNPVTRLDYSLASAGDVSVTLFNMMGQEVHRYAVGTRPAGEHGLTVDASDLASGLYLAQLSVNGQVRDTHKLMLVK